MRAFVDALLAVFVASPCAACGEPLEQPTRGPVCAGCWQAIHPLPPPVCDVCGDSLASWRSVGDRPRCVRCRRTPRFVDRARSVGAYEGALRSIVHALKYEGRRSLACPLARLMVSRGSEVLTGADAIVPVPLHPSRLRSRGFNQAVDLANHLGGRVVPALARTRATLPQADLPAARRHANVRNAFAPTRKAASLPDGVVVLIDDVCTTGATLDACAYVLKTCGVREVRALTAARASIRVQKLRADVTAA
jgi:ComF family protein